VLYALAVDWGRVAVVAAVVVADGVRRDTERGRLGCCRTDPA